MTNRNPLATLGEMAGHWCTPGQCCDGYCTDDIHGLSKEDSEQIRKVAGDALAEAQAVVSTLTAERDDAKQEAKRYHERWTAEIDRSNIAEARRDDWEGKYWDLRAESRILPCDAGCVNYPEEDCSRHGREPSVLWRIIDEIRSERDQLREALGRVEALARGPQPTRDTRVTGGYWRCQSDVLAAIGDATDAEAGQ